MQKTVTLEKIEPGKVDSPAINWLTHESQVKGLTFYEGWHHVDGRNQNVTRIFIAHDEGQGNFVVGEGGNKAMHGWYEDDGAIQAAFFDWCFYPRELSRSEDQ